MCSMVDSKSTEQTQTLQNLSVFGLFHEMKYRLLTLVDSLLVPKTDDQLDLAGAAAFA